MKSNYSVAKTLKIGGVLTLIVILALAGKWILFPRAVSASALSGSGPNTANVSVVSGEVQEVSITLTSRGYAPIVVQKGIPVRFHILAEEKDINGCNGTVIIPAFNVQTALKPGDNVLEFTPDKAGTIGYSCWMGMISSSIRVVDDIKNTDQPVAPVSAGSNGLKMPCCQLR